MLAAGFNPATNSSLSLLFPLLPARTVLVEKAADVPRMITNAKLLLDDEGNAPGGPFVCGKPERCRAARKQQRQLGELFSGQQCLPTS